MVTNFRFCLRPDGNRSNKHTYVSVFLRVMKGDFDAILPWPFRCDVTFTLLDQKDRINVSERISNHLIYRPNSDAYISTIGSVRFVSHKNLMTPRYLSCGGHHVSSSGGLSMQLSSILRRADVRLKYYRNAENETINL